MLKKAILFLVRQAHHERNHALAVRLDPLAGHGTFGPSLSKDTPVRPGPVEGHCPFVLSLSKGLAQRFPSGNVVRMWGG